MRILAIDTVTEACSAALFLDGQCLARVEQQANRHSSLILPMVESLLAEAGATLASLDAIAFDRGPGSFTGLRIGAGVAQGLAFAASLPVCAVSSLETLAAGCAHDRVLAAIDARMGQVYWALYEAGGDEPEERLDDPDRVRVAGGGIHGVGSGWDAHAGILRHAAGDHVLAFTPGRYPMAEDVARLAATRHACAAVAPEHAVPVYIRNKVTG